MVARTINFHLMSHQRGDEHISAAGHVAITGGIITHHVVNLPTQQRSYNVGVCGVLKLGGIITSCVENLPSQQGSWDFKIDLLMPSSGSYGHVVIHS